MDIINAINKIEDIEQLQNEVFKILQKFPYENQLMLQTLDQGVEDWLTGVGTVEGLENKIEKDYVHLQPSLAGSLIEHYVNLYGGFRSRIMIIPPKQCYTVHADKTVRIHIPIVTNEHCWMIWPYDQKCYQLKPGVAYKTNTTKRHTFFNGDNEKSRIHIVMCIR
jgi:hypothetical protein